jgi:hypothetical protein
MGDRRLLYLTMTQQQFNIASASVHLFPVVSEKSSLIDVGGLYTGQIRGVSDDILPTRAESCIRPKLISELLSCA